MPEGAGEGLERVTSAYLLGGPTVRGRSLP